MRGRRTRNRALAALRAYQAASFCFPTSVVAFTYHDTMTMYCQKCRAPLKLDNSLEDLNPAAFDLLVGMLTS